MDENIKNDSRQAFINQHTQEGYPLDPWIDIEFEQWWSNDKRVVCMNQRNKAHGTRCYRPCEHCLLLRARGV
jgi:hypothetical protein